MLLDYCRYTTSNFPQMTFSEINYMYDVKDWLFGVYLPTIENPFFIYNNDTSQINSILNDLNLIGNRASRASFRYFEAKPDYIYQKSPYDELAFYQRSYVVMDPFTGPLPGEFTDTLYDFIMGYEKNDWKYNEPGSDKTSNKAGGYSVFFEKGNDTTYNTILKHWIFANKTFNNLLGYASFDNIFYSSYYGQYAFCKFEFIQKPSGNTLPKRIITVK